MLFKMPDGRFVLAAWARRSDARTLITLDRNGAETGELTYELAGRVPVTRHWGFFDWARRGRPKGFQRMEEEDKEQFGVSLTTRPMLLYGVPEQVSIRSVEVFNRPVPRASGMVIPGEIAFVFRKGKGKNEKIALDDARCYRYLMDGREYSPQDISAEIGVDYDPENLHVRIDVVDDAFFQEAPKNEIWKGDSVQFAFAAFDPDSSAARAATGYGICQGADGEVICRRDYSQLNLSAATGVTARVVRKPGHIAYELVFPFKELGIDPFSGVPVGMSVVINDNDGKGRKGYLRWGDGIGTGRINPNEFGWLILK